MKIIISESQLKHIIVEQTTSCENVISYDMLNQAKQWWLQHLDVNFDKNLINRVILTKYGKVSPSQKLTTQVLFDIEKAKQEITGITKINYVNLPDYDANAYYQAAYPNQISVNCSKFDSKETEFNLTVLIHELQHAIHQYIGPVKSWDTAYIKKTLPSSMPLPRLIDKQHPYTMWDKTKDKVSSLFFNHNKKYEDLGDEQKFDKGYILMMNQKNQGLRYSCNADEVQARVAQVKSYLKLGAGEPITLDMLKNDNVYKMFYYNLLCWANRKDNVSLQDYLNSLNSLVMNNKVGTSNQV